MVSASEQVTITHTRGVSLVSARPEPPASPELPPQPPPVGDAGPGAGPQLSLREARGLTGPEPIGAAVLLLHGGQAESRGAVRPWNLALARMRLLVPPLVERRAEPRIAVGVLRYRYRGWNGEAADPVHDALGAVDRILARYGPVPVVLIGHSMGGRAALRAAGHDAVAGVAALAPWVPDGEPVDQLAGRTVLILHGDEDRTTSTDESLRFAVRARRAGAAVCRLRIEGSGHTMVRRAADWNLLTAGFALGLLGAAPMPGPVAAALAGRRADAEPAPGARSGHDAQAADGADDLDAPLDRGWRLPAR
jgi:dienelactone hydrolase